MKTRIFIISNVPLRIRPEDHIGSGRQAGFTLLEVLLVVAIIAVMAGLASLAIGGNEARLLQQEAQRLQQLLLMSQDEATFQQRNLGLKLDDNGYRFYRLDEREAEWVELLDKPFTEHRFKLPLQANLELDGNALQLLDDTDSNAKTPQLVFLSSGENSAFILQLTLAQQQQPVQTLYSDGFSAVTLGAPPTHAAKQQR